MPPAVFHLSEVSNVRPTSNEKSRPRENAPIYGAVVNGQIRSIHQSYQNGLGAVPKRMTSEALAEIRLHEDVIVSMDGEIEQNGFTGFEGYEEIRRQPDSRKVQFAVAFLSILSLTPFLLLVIHLAVLFGPIRSVPIK